MSVLSKKTVSFIRLNHNPEKIEKFILSLFRERILFDPKDFGFLFDIIFQNIYLGRDDKMRLMQKLSEFKIPYYHRHYWGDVLDNLKYYFMMEDIEMLECLIKSDAISQYYKAAILDFLNVNMLIWIWDKIKFSNLCIKGFIIHCAEYDKFEHIQILVEIYKLDLNKISQLKSQGFILNYLIYYKRVKMLKYLVKNGLDIKNRAVISLKTIIENVDFEFLILFCDNFEEFYGAKSLRSNADVYVVAVKVANRKNYEILNLVLRIIPRHFLICLVEKLIVAKWFDPIPMFLTDRFTTTPES